MRRLREIDNSGVSEVVGALLLLFLVVVGVGGVAVILLSQPLPEETPNADIVISSAGGEVLLTHNGGDELSEGTVEVRFDGRPVEVEFTGDGNWPWGIGEILHVTGEDPPERVTVISTSGMNSVIKSSYLTGTGIEPGGPDEVPDPIQTVTPGQDPEDYLEKLKEGSVYFYRPGWFSSDVGFWDTVLSGMLRFRVTGSDSYLITEGGERHDLSINDVVKIEPVYHYHFDQELRIFMVSGKGWQIRAVPKEAFRVSVNNGLLHGKLSDSWITGSDDIESNLSLISGYELNLDESYTKLVINDKVIVDENDGSQYIFSDISPALPELMVLDLSSDGSVLFMGNVSKLKKGDAVIWPE